MIKITYAIAVLMLSSINIEVNAATLTFDLNCIKSGSRLCTSHSSVGSIVLTDNGNNVDVKVNSVVGTKYKKVVLNVNPAWNDFVLEASAGSSGVNTERLKPWKTKFDFSQNKSVSTAVGFTISAKKASDSSVIDLSVYDFDFLSEMKAPYLKAGVHLQACTKQYVNNPCDGDSLKAGSMVPIPATVWLFGSGLMGLVGFARKKSSSV